MSTPPNKFEEAVKNGESNHGFVREFVSFLKSNKKWWLAPIMVILLLFGILIILGATGAAPFIYTLF